MSRRIKISHSQLALPFGEMRARAISYESRQRFFWFIVSVSLLSLLSYVYAVNAIAHHTAVRENLEAQVSMIESRMGALEFAYIELKNDITLELAYQYGFQEVKEPLYVSRSTSPALTLNTHKR